MNFLDTAPTYRLPLEGIPRQLPLDVQFNVLKLVNSSNLTLYIYVVRFIIYQAGLLEP